MSIFNVFTLLGGLALFLFGMDLMGKALERQAGGRLQSILNSVTSSRITGFLLGLGVTAVIQSSSATTVMLVGFVNSGIMQLKQAIPIIMGSNVGTTVTAWILSLSGISGESFFVQLLKPTSFTPVLALIGIIMYMFCKSDKKKNVGTILLGFAVLMFGMDAMSGAMKPLKDEAWFAELFLKFSNPILGVLVGAVLTGIIQSSSASVGILQALSATGAVPISAAIPIIMGQNIGTCVTALISSVGANRAARRTAMVHLYFNIIGVITFMILFYGINLFFPWPFLELQASELNIAIIHTAFNLLTTGILLPLTGTLEKLAYLTVKAIPDDNKPSIILDERLFASPGVAAQCAWTVACEMANIVRDGFLKAAELPDVWDEKSADKIFEYEDKADMYEDAIGTYLVKLSSHPMNRDDNITVNITLQAINDFERIADHSQNIMETAREISDKNVQFSTAAQKELSVLKTAVTDLLNRTIDAFINKDFEAASKVEPQEEVIDGLVRDIKARHIERLRLGTCTIEYGFILNDLLTNYERIADHCSNIAIELLEVSRDEFNIHEYENTVKTDAAFERRYERYLERYSLESEDNN